MAAAPSDSPTPARPPLLRWLYVDLNAYFASVEQQLRPELRGRPIAVGPEEIASGTIIAASYEAKRYGVKTGQRVAEARRLCPEIRIVGGRHDRYVEFHEAIVAEVWRHVPVHAVCSIDEVACRLADNENDPADARALAQRIKAGIRAHVGECLTASVGIAPSRLLAKIAADMEKPDGLTLIEGHELPERLYGLALDDIPGVGRRMLARLHARGIASVAELLARAPAAAGAAWGSVVGARLWWSLMGHDLPERPRQSRSISHSHVLSPERRAPDAALPIARRLLAKAASRLRAAGGKTAHVSLHARLESGRRWSATARLAPDDDTAALMAALETLWPRLVAALGRDRIRTIGVSLDGVKLAQERHPDLFERAGVIAPPASRRAAAAIDALNARFGRHAVGFGPAPVGRQGLIGAKIAFGRIPERAEFHA